jgi:hypothetical protein
MLKILDGLLTVQSLSHTFHDCLHSNIDIPMYTSQCSVGLFPKGYSNVLFKQNLPSYWRVQQW